MHDQALDRPPYLQPDGSPAGPARRSTAAASGVGVVFRPRVDDRDDDLNEDESLLAVHSFLSLKNPKTVREQTGTLSTAGAT